MQVMNVYGVNYAQSANAVKYAAKDKSANSMQQKDVQNTKVFEMPSFGARKPLTEEAKCRKMLLDAKTEDGKMRFVTKDEIAKMMAAIKQFKTTGSKSEMLQQLLVETKKVGKKKVEEITDLNAEHITAFFKYMSGKSARIQKFMIMDLAESGILSADSRVALLSSGTVSDTAFSYIDKHLAGDVNAKYIKFQFFLDYLENCPKMVNYRKIIIDKMNMGVGEVFDTVTNLTRKYRPESHDEKNIINVISLINTDNVYKMHDLSERLLPLYPKTVAEFLSLLNSDNLDYACEASLHEDIREVIQDLKVIKENNIELPKLKDVGDDELYYRMVSRQIEEITDKDNDGDDDDI